MKQILALVEGGVTNELTKVEHSAQKMESMAEYLYIKHVLLRPSIAQALQNEGSLSKIVEE